MPNNNPAGATIQRERQIISISKVMPHASFDSMTRGEWHEPIMLLNKEVLHGEDYLPATFEQLTEAHFEKWLD
ncbi:hypothetical protein [Ignatzschineria indica]|uniref:hypothetical protein n=1 Tax=Ignatzschineria indica TaxID=472583 RepID=UPI003639DF50